MRIAFLADVYLPTVGGVETATANQKKALEALGHEVFVIAPAAQKSHTDDVNIIRVRSSIFSRFSGGYGIFVPSLHQMNLLKRTLIKIEPDIIHVVGDLGLNHAGSTIARTLDIPVVYTPHTFIWKQLDRFGKFAMPATWLTMAIRRLLFWRIPFVRCSRETSESWSSWMWRRYILSLANVADVVAPPSHTLADLLKSWGCSSDIIVNPNCVNSAQTTTLSKKPTILWIGRMSHEKRPLEFVQAVQQARSSTKAQFDVMMIGGGPLCEDAKMLDVSKSIVFTPYVKNEEVRKLYQKISFLCITSYDFDNQPMVIAESLMAGRGVLYRDANLREGLTEGAGFLTRDSSVEALAEAIVELVEQPKKISTMSEKAEKSRLLFSFEQAGSRLESVYRRAVSKSDGSHT